MSDLRLEVEEIRGEIAVLEAELEELRQEALADGKIDPEEEVAIEQTRKLLEQARMAQQEVHVLIEPSPAPADDPSDVLQPDTEESPVEVAVAANIGGSVGHAGKNDPQDTATVQTLLNSNGASPKLDVDGLCGPKTVGAIASFQKASLGFADGRVDVGGKTWAALLGAAPGGQGGIGGGDTTEIGGGSPPDMGPSEPVPMKILPAEEERTQSKAPDDGEIPLFKETFVTAGPFTFKNQFDANGNLISCETETNVAGLVLSIPLGLYTLSGGFQLLDVKTEVFDPKGPVVPVAVKIALKGFGAVEFGVQVAKATYELSLEGHSLAGKILHNTKDPKATTSDIPAATQVFIKGAGECKVSGGAGVESGTVVMKGEYDKLLIVTIKQGPEVTVQRGPGVDKFNEDFLAAIELAKKNPEIVGTGGMGGWSPGDPPQELDPAREKLEADAMQHIADDAQRIMVEAREQQLRERRAALEDPNVVGGANSLNHKDPSQAAKLYGALWQKRTDAITSASAYSPYYDGGPASPEAKAHEAETLASTCESVRQAFRSSDAQWGYGQSGASANTGGGTPQGQPDEDEESIVDEVLDFFGLNDGDKKE